MSRIVLVDMLAVLGAGQETRARQFLRRVGAVDSDTRYVVLRARGMLADLPAAPGTLEFIDVDVPRGRLQGLRRALLEYRLLPKVARQLGADVFLTFSHFLPHGLPVPVKVVGVSNLAPFSEAAMHHASLSGRLRLYLLRRSIVSSCRRATRVLAFSDACRKHLMARGVAESGIRVVSNGADEIGAAQTQPPGPRAATDPTAFTVLTIGHFYSYKNYECVLRAADLLPENIRSKVRLVFVGPPAETAYFQRIEALARELSPRVSTRIVPGLPRAELAQLYRGCDLFVFPTYVENSPNVMLEAMAAGAPCVVSSAEPMPEYGADAVRYFDPDAPAELAAQMAGLLPDAAARAALGEAARARVARYTWDTFVRAVVDTYRR